MRLKYQTFFATASVLILAAATSARADVTISSDATANMSCSGGVCAPTAADAVLNVGDLQNLLASGNVTVTTTGSAVQATNIDVTANLGWSSNALTLDSYQSLNVTAPVTVSGKNGLSLLTNDGGSGGELAFSGKGHVTFKKLSGSLSINGARYALVNSIASLAAAIQRKPSGNFALAADYNASKDGVYSNSPIATIFDGVFEGLGNSISKLTITVQGVGGQAIPIGLFAEIGQSGMASDLRLEKANVSAQKLTGKHTSVFLGALVALNEGSLMRVSVSGSVAAPKSTWIGGLVGSNTGSISESSSAVVVDANNSTPLVNAGSLVGLNQGGLLRSYATGSVTGRFGSGATGGLVGETYSTSQITDCYATGTAAGNAAGGLIGDNNGSVGSSYSTGKPVGLDYTGGFVGADGSAPGSLTNTYWDTTTSGITNLSQGAGNIANDSGITGLTTEQLQSGLPAGFDPSVWGENADMNNGLPYLLANPPK
jgi:hypothetical protein